MIETKETYVNATEKRRFGESGWQEARTADRGKLFRALQREFGRCVSRVYVDRKVQQAQPVFISPLFARPAPPERWETVPVGWVFVKRMTYEDARPDGRTRSGRPRYREQDYYLREVWVEVREVPDDEDQED